MLAQERSGNVASTYRGRVLGFSYSTRVDCGFQGGMIRVDYIGDPHWTYVVWPNEKWTKAVNKSSSNTKCTCIGTLENFFCCFAYCGGYAGCG